MKKGVVKTLQIYKGNTQLKPVSSFPTPYHHFWTYIIIPDPHITTLPYPTLHHNAPHSTHIY